MDRVALGSGTYVRSQHRARCNVHFDGEQIGDEPDDADISVNIPDGGFIDVDQNIEIASGMRLAARNRAEEGGMQDATLAQRSLVCTKDIKGCAAIHAATVLEIGAELKGSLQVAAPTVSAIWASRVPKGCSGPRVVSASVWCSISALISAPTRTIVVEIQIQVMKPITAPSEP